MKFITESRIPHGHLVGSANCGSRAEHALCKSYSDAADRLLDPGDRLVPVVAEPWPFHDPDCQRRRLFEPADEPGIAEAVFGLIGFEPDGADVLAVLPPGLAEAGLSGSAVLQIVVMDAATWMVENEGPPAGLGWIGGEVTRAALAARLLRGAEGAGMVSADEAADGYRAICAAALSGLASERHEENGEVLLTREEPGLVTLIGLVVQAARKAAAPALPLELMHETDLARAAVLRAMPGRKRPRKRPQAVTSPVAARTTAASPSAPGHGH